MKAKKLFRIASLMFLGSTFLLPADAAGQWMFRIPKWLTRYELGYTFPMAWADYRQEQTLPNPITGGFTSFSHSESVSSKFSYGTSIGTFFPLQRLGQKSSLALSVSLVQNMYTWDYPSLEFVGFAEDAEPIYTFTRGSLQGVTMVMGLPVGADLKFGSDAVSSKDVRFNATIGAGVLPSMSMTSDYDNAGFGFNTTPYVKVEGGIMAGICIKLRVMATMGNMSFYDVSSSTTGFGATTSSASSLIGKQTVSFSLILMPFSWGWEERGWWNTPY